MTRSPGGGARGAPEATQPGPERRDPEGPGLWPSGWGVSGPCRNLRFGEAAPTDGGNSPARTAGIQLTVPEHPAPFPVAVRLLYDDLDGLFGVELRAGTHHATLRAAALALGPATLDDVGLHEIALPLGRVRVDDLDRAVVILAHAHHDSW